MSATTLYQSCATAVDTDGEVMECISNNLQFGIDAFFLLFAACLVFFMQAGFAMLCAGCVRTKNVQNSMLKNFLDACGAGLSFWAVGYAFAFGGSSLDGPTTFLGTTNFFLMNLTENFYLSPVVNPEVFWLFQFAFAATAATIVAGTLAERCQMSAYLWYSICLTGFVYPVVAHAVWSPNGWLSPANPNYVLFGVGVIDFSGSGVVHVTGGITALMAACILGPRRGRFYDNRGNVLPEPVKFVPHSPALQVLGTFVLWFGWYGFNPGSALFVSTRQQGVIAGHAALTTTLSASAGCASAMLTNLLIKERTTGESVFDLNYALNGALSGLVAITAGCTVVESWAAVVVGIIAGWIYMLGSHYLLRFRIDDAVDAIPVHFVNGLWGLFQVGLFATPYYMDRVYGNSSHVGWFYELARGSVNAHLLAAQLVGLAFIAGWSMLLMFPFFFGLNYLGWLRSDSLEEVVGLDISYHGANALELNGVDTAGSNLEYVEAMRVHRNLTEAKGRRKSGDMGGNTSEATEAVTADMAATTPADFVDTGGARDRHMSEIIKDMIAASASECSVSHVPDTSEVEYSDAESVGGGYERSDLGGTGVLDRA